MKHFILRLLMAAAALVAATPVLAQPTAFTYQGVLTQLGAPANGTNDFVFAVFNAPSGGAQQGGSVVLEDVTVSNGLFTVTLDFGANVFDGGARWLEIAVRPGISTGAHTKLTPRQPITSAPYAVRAANASAVNAANIAGTLALGQLPSAVLTNGGTFSGNGTSLTNLDASNLATGTVPDARLSANVALRAGGNAYSGNQTVTGGSVGIGTIAPVAPLDFSTDLGDKISLWGTSPSNLFGFGIQRALLQIHSDWQDSDIAFGHGPSANMTELMRIKGTGNVGIGTTTPISKLHVNGTVTASDFVGGGGALSNLSAGQLTAGTVSDARLSANVALRAGGNAYSGNQTMTGGSVGIGTTTPVAPLDLSQNLGDKISLWGSSPSNIIGFGIQGGLMQIHTDQSLTDIAFGYGPSASMTERMRIKGSGNVGIGVTNPVSKLHVNGTVTASDFVGGGGALSNLSAGQLTAGTISEARLSANVALRAGGNAYAGNQTVTGGRVGIGTTTPVAPLDLSQNLGDKISLWGSSPSNLFGFGVQGALLQIHSDWQGSDIAFGHGPSANMTELMRIKGTGNVGISTANPKGMLHVNGAYYGQGDVRLHAYSGDGTGGTAFVQARDDSGTSSIGLQLRTQSAGAIREAVYIGPDGNVGISTTDPGLNDVQINPTFHSAKGYGLVVSRADYGMNVQISRPYGTGGIGLLVDNSYLGDSSTSLLLVRNNVAGTPQTVMNVRADGRTQVKELEITGGADLAEPFSVASEIETKPGMVMAIHPDNPGELRVATEAYDRTVAGIISGAGGVRPGLVLRQEDSVADGSHPVALSGRVYCWVDADANGAVRPGDLLTTSHTPGHAMRATDASRSHGAVLGKAMTKLESGRGMVLVLVNLQ